MSLYFYTGEPDAGADDGQESHKATLDEIIDELKAYGLPNIKAAESQHRHTPNDVARIVATALTPPGDDE